MTSPLPDIAADRLVAGALTWPLVAPDAIGLYKRTAPGCRFDHWYRDCREAFVRKMAPRARGLSTEQIDLMYDLAWSPKHWDPSHDWSAPDQGPPLHHLCTVAGALFTDRGEALHLRWEAPRDEDRRVNPQLVRVLQCWRELTLVLPPHLLVAAYVAGRVEARGSWRDVPPPLVLLPLPLRYLAEQGFTETHQHYGASAAFPDQWASLVQSALTQTPRQLRDALPEDPPPWGREATPSHLALTALCERWLVHRLLLSPAEDGATPFDTEEDRLSTWRRPLDERQLLLEAYASLRPVRQPLGLHLTLRRLGLGRPRRPLEDQVEEIERQRGSPTRRTLRSNTVSAAHLLQHRLAVAVLRLLSADPIPSESKADDPLTRRLAARWLCTQVQAYGWFVQEPGIPGLGHFHRAFARARLGRPSQESLLRGALGRPNHRSIELRTSPAGGVWKERRHLADLASLLLERVLLDATSEGAGRLEAGFVLHLRKPGPEERKLRDERNPRAMHPRFLPWFRREHRSAASLIRLLDRIPQAILLLRGFDVAGVELSAPLWPIAPLLRQLRAAGDRAARRLSRQGWTNLFSPRLTLHLGEDYHHPLQGLRNIAQPLEMDLFQVGDRLGHGIALSSARDALSVGRSSAALSLLLDLRWERSLYLRNLVTDLPRGRLRRIEERICELANFVWGKNVCDDWLLALDLMAGALQCARCLRANGWLPPSIDLGPAPVGPCLCEAPPTIPKSALFSVLFDRSVIERSESPWTIEPADGSPEVIRPIRHYLRRRLAERGICVETNPSSNYLIADLPRLQHHPLFSFTQPNDLFQEEGPRLWASVNTDDPLTMATSMEQEWALVVHTAIEAGLGMREVQEWSQRVNEDAWRSRFTLPHSADPDLLWRLFDSLDPTQARHFFNALRPSEQRALHYGQVGHRH
jgi:hypothetical protein